MMSRLRGVRKCLSRLIDYTLEKQAPQGTSPASAEHLPRNIHPPCAVTSLSSTVEGWMNVSLHSARVVGPHNAAVHGHKEKHLVLLRDGRTLIGYLRSIDQFANLVLHQTVERIHVGKKYGDIPRGIFVVRGENVVLLGEIDLEKESDTQLLQVSIEEILEEQRVEQQNKQEAERVKVQALKERGLSIPRADTLDEY
ncbi:U6 snRNA-associated Sm-like protein LSm1 isoform X1 [Dendropsophus ebraccatus]|uniref:U6 snRNA-associated Sm-like protein LSm1 isoform X1 n=1 Tax=Dendropsophus ebraccatus TaxID=150705 RepID=UPI0038315D18